MIWHRVGYWQDRATGDGSAWTRNRTYYLKIWSSVSTDGVTTHLPIYIGRSATALADLAVPFEDNGFLVVYVVTTFGYESVAVT